jgi:hypothetical protein
MKAGDWLALGIEKGWIDVPVCYVHDMPALTDEEAGLVDENDGDMDVICFPVARLRV